MATLGGYIFRPNGSTKEDHMRVLFLVIGLGFSFVLASGTELLAAEPKDGDACKVSSGANQGKVGKYTEGATWCEGDWGARSAKTHKAIQNAHQKASSTIFLRV